MGNITTERQISTTPASDNAKTFTSLIDILTRRNTGAPSEIKMTTEAEHLTDIGMSTETPAESTQAPPKSTTAPLTEATTDPESTTLTASTTSIKTTASTLEPSTPTTLSMHTIAVRTEEILNPRRKYFLD